MKEIRETFLLKIEKAMKFIDRSFISRINEIDFNVMNPGEFIILLEKISKVIRSTDSMVEQKAMSYIQLMDTGNELMNELGITPEEQEMTHGFFQRLKKDYGEKLDDRYVMPRETEDLGDGIVLIKLSRTILKQDTFRNPRSCAEDLIENWASSLLFADLKASPGKVHTFFTVVTAS